MFLFTELQKILVTYLSKSKIRFVIHAFLFAADCHESQKRVSGEPYMMHPVAVAIILANMNMDEKTIAAALLHDVVEDTSTNYKEIEKLFGNKVAELVDGVTKLTQINFRSAAEAQAENFRKMMLAMVEDIRVILIKLADRLHNMQTISAMPWEKRRRKIKETLEIYAPIAHRLGMNNFKNAFQDLSFAALYPLRYRVLQECVNNAWGNRKKLFSKIHEKIKQELVKQGIKDAEVVGRKKRQYSIYQKMRHRGQPFSEIMDVYAFRIVIDNRLSCYHMLGLLHSIYKPIPGRFKDYIAIPKANGYQSLHTTLFGPYGVPVEVQIRTHGMNYAAEEGVAAHWIYKSDTDEATNRTKKWFRGLQDMQQNAINSLEFIESVKIDLFPGEVYVFTPLGHIISLPKNATVIDFAYAVHTEIGNRCSAVKVNRKLVPFSQRLLDGQTVEIITSPSVHPSKEWLSFAVTGKAIAAIKQYLKGVTKKDSSALGKRLLTYALARFNLTWDQVDKNVRGPLYSSLGISGEKDLYIKIGQGECASAIVAHKILDIMHVKATNTQQDSQITMPIPDAESINIHFSQCCYPIPGDDIRGVLVKGKGIEVHVTDCNVLMKKDSARHPDEFVPLNWSEEKQRKFSVKIVVFMENQCGAIALLSGEIAREKSDIEEFHIDECDPKYGVLSVTVKVYNRQHLADLLRHLRNLDTVIRVSRVKPGK
ncbi:MAG: bifunctional GTP diphosphokinase/guanosine-3',5'-bis(diphosphate) 3'-diphosphatase [Thiotrichales bacterium]|nr:MAG: bifunctional GTP diphosphokinase/guanosine-3',5'-bis(diphosphate) 3'-diphosphatase [Thiotrichales bacterium]